MPEIGPSHGDLGLPQPARETAEAKNYRVDLTKSEHVDVHALAAGRTGPKVQVQYRRLRPGTLVGGTLALIAAGGLVFGLANRGSGTDSGSPLFPQRPAAEAPAVPGPADAQEKPEAGLDTGEERVSQKLDHTARKVCLTILDDLAENKPGGPEYAASYNQKTGLMEIHEVSLQRDGDPTEFSNRFWFKLRPDAPIRNATLPSANDWRDALLDDDTHVLATKTVEGGKSLGIYVGEKDILTANGAGADLLAEKVASGETPPNHPDIQVLQTNGEQRLAARTMAQTTDRVGGQIVDDRRASRKIS